MEYRGAHAIDSFHVVLPYLFSPPRKRKVDQPVRRRADSGDDLNLLMTMMYTRQAKKYAV